MTRIRWRVVTGIALGVLLGIYAASCGEDNRPDATDTTPLNIVVKRIDVTNGIASYRLLGPDYGAGVVSVDTDTELAQFLATHKRITVQ